MDLAAAGLAEEVDHLVAVDEVELSESEDAVAIERGLEGEVKAGQRLDPTWTPPSGKLFRVSSMQGRCRLLAPQMTIYG